MRRNCGMDSGHSNEARWPNNTLLTYTLPRTVKVRESVDVVLIYMRGRAVRAKLDENVMARR